MGNASSLLETTWSATQAAISVILVLVYGYMARHRGLLSEEGEHSASSVSVKIFLPCLLFSEIGPLASWDNIKEYWIIIVYSLSFQFISWVFGVFGVWALRMPEWIVPCMIFNNATSLPLLLLTSLGSNGTLEGLILPGDNLSGILKRGKVYLLINALVCNLTRFSLGPHLLHPHTPETPKHITYRARRMSRALTHLESPHLIAKPEHPFANSDFAIGPSHDELEPYPAIEPYPEESETAPLLSRTNTRSWRVRIASIVKSVWKEVEEWLNPPMIGGLAAVLAGAIPFLHRILFDEGAILSPFTQSLDNIGSLYTVLQMFVLGAHLKSKKGSKPPILPLLYLFIFRFAVMPLISTSVIYGVRKAAGSHILEDPVLDFTMAIAHVGPPALTLAAIVEMSDAGEETAAAVAQTIVLSYVVTPLISISVAGSLAVVKGLYH